MLLAVLPLVAAAAAIGPLPRIVPADYQEACPVSAHWRVTFDNEVYLGPSNTVRFTTKGMQWNRVPMSEQMLGEAMRNAARTAPRPVTIVDGYYVPCDDLRRITDMLEGEAACSPRTCVVSFVTPTMRAVPMPPPPPAPSPDAQRRPAR